MIVEAKDFAGPKTQGHHFGGAQRAQIIAALEKFTQGVRDGRVLMQDVTLSTKASVADYLMTTLSLTYAEKDDPSIPVATLYGPEVRLLDKDGKIL